MTPAMLIADLSAEIREVIKDYELPAEMQDDKKVTVYEYDLPHGDAEDTFIPYVIVTPKLIDLVERDTIMTVAFLINIYAGEPGNDWRNMMSIAERIRQFLFTKSVVAKKYLREGAYHFEPIASEQPSPFILGYIECDFRIATPEPAMKYKFVKGN